MGQAQNRARAHAAWVTLYFTPNPFLFRTLAQRAAKRAKAQVVVIEDEPTATTGGAPETTLPDPATFPESIPQRSP